MEEIFLYQESCFLIVIEMYYNGWLVLFLKDFVIYEIYMVLMVNLEDKVVFLLFDRVFVDINNNFDVMEFFLFNKLVEDIGYRCQSGWVSYLMVIFNFLMFYRFDLYVFSVILNIW